MCLSETLETISLERESFQRLLGEKALFKREQEDNTDTNKNNAGKKQGKGVQINAGEDKFVTKKFRGTGFMHKAQLEKLLEDASDDEIGTGPKFANESNGEKNTAKVRRGTGFITANQLDKLAEENDDDQKGNVQFDAETDDAPKKKYRGTGFIHKDQFTKLQSDLEKQEVEEEGAEAKVNFDTSAEASEVGKKFRSTGFMTKKQLANLLLEADEAGLFDE